MEKKSKIGRKIVVILVAFTMLFSVALFSGCGTALDPSELLRQQITETGQQITELQNGEEPPTLSQLEALQKQLEELRQKVEKLEAQEQALLSQIEEYKGKLLELKIANIKAEIAELERRIYELGQGNAALQEMLDGLREELDKLIFQRPSEKLEARIRQDFYNRVGGDVRFLNPLFGLFYGRHSGAYVFFLPGDDGSVNFIVVSGVTFMLSRLSHLLIWSNGAVFEMREAYEQGLFDHATVRRIGDIHYDHRNYW